MTSAYSLADTLPKDAAGAKSIALIDLATSQLDYALYAGIGTKTASSKNYAALYAGNAVGGCKVETPVVGNLLMGAFSQNASGIAVNAAIPIRADDRGQAFVTALSSTTCAFIATSHDTITTASGILYSVYCAGCGVVAGACLVVHNGGTSLAGMVFSQANESLREFSLKNGTCFGSLIVERRGTVSPMFVTVEYRSYGMG